MRIIQPSLGVREAKETAPDPWWAFTSSISTTLVAPVIGTMTPGDFIRCRTGIGISGVIRLP
jgi:hypothetical protein